MKIDNLKENFIVRRLAWEAYKFGCRNPRDIDHPDTPKVFDFWYTHIFS